MPKIVHSTGSTEYEHVTIKANGWVKAYDDVSGPRGNREYENLMHYPPQQVKTVYGQATYESPHGKI